MSNRNFWNFKESVTLPEDLLCIARVVSLRNRAGCAATAGRGLPLPWLLRRKQQQAGVRGSLLQGLQKKNSPWRLGEGAFISRVDPGEAPEVAGGFSRC